MHAVSVIIPLYNMEKYLYDCLESVLTQEKIDLEVILVDDGSTDGSAFICDKIMAKDLRVKVIHQKNQGPSVARNAGMQVATGEYLLFLDSDDLYNQKNAISILYNHAKKNELQVLNFNYKRFSNIDAIQKSPVIQTPKMQNTKNILTLVQANAYQSSACIKLIENEWLKQQNIRFEPSILCEDILFSGQLLAQVDRMDFLDEAFYLYRIRPSSTTNSITEKNIWSILSVLKRLTEVQVEDKRVAAYRGYMAFQYSTLLLNWRLAGSPTSHSEWEQIKELSWLLKGALCKEAKMVSNVSHVLGLKMTSRLLEIYFRATFKKIKSVNT